MARVNISIPDELRARMEGLNCNWSAIAQEAFAIAVEIEELKHEGHDMDAGLVRLRNNKRADSAREHSRGMSHGRTWALEEASYENLEELVRKLEWANGSPERHEELINWVDQKLQNSILDLPDIKAPTFSRSYINGYLEGVRDVYLKV